MTLVAGEQQIIPEVVDELRRRGVAGLGSGSRALAGAVFATAVEGDMSGIVIGARTGSQGGGGQYSVFYNAVPEGAAFTEEAWVDGLQQNKENRSNLALVNTGEVDESPSVFHLEIYDGETGLLAETVVTKPIPAPGLASDQRDFGQLRPGDRAGVYPHREGVGGRTPSWPTGWSTTAGLRESAAATEPTCPRGSRERGRNQGGSWLGAAKYCRSADCFRPPRPAFLTGEESLAGGVSPGHPLQPRLRRSPHNQDTAVGQDFTGSPDGQPGRWP